MVTEWRRGQGPIDGRQLHEGGAGVPTHLAYRFIEKAALTPTELEALEANTRALMATTSAEQAAGLRLRALSIDDPMHGPAIPVRLSSAPAAAVTPATPSLQLRRGPGGRYTLV